jgi:hypothetical protein
MADAVKKIPKRVQKIADACRGRQTLHLALPQVSRGETNRRFWFEPSGRAAATQSAEEAIGLGLLVPAGDCLFGNADSQTFRAP